MKRLPLICAAIAICICGSIPLLPAKTALSATATVQFSNGNTITVTDFSNQIGVQPLEYVNITLQFTPAPADQPVIIEASNGGATSFGSSIPVIDAKGSITFGFLAPAKTGIKSIGIRIGSTTVRLQFAVGSGQN